jgi:colanic acid biosynthesis glycosyl transferase WcaI
LFDSSIAITSVLTALSVPRVDVTICLSPPVQTTILGAAIRFKLGKIVILVKDLPTEAARSVGMMTGDTKLRLARSVESMAYKLADHVVVITSVFASYVERLGVDASRISEISDWANLDAIDQPPADQEMRDRLGAQPGDFLVVHSGNMGVKQDLLNVVEAAARLDVESGIKVALVGDGTERTKVEARVATRQIANLKMLPLQSKEDFPRVLAAADLLLVNQAPEVIDSVLPSKLLTYMAAGRPLLVAVHPHSTTAEVVRRAGCGVIAEPGQPDALARAIRGMAKELKTNADYGAMGERGRHYAEEHFNRARVLSQWDSLLAQLVSQPVQR